MVCTSNSASLAADDLLDFHPGIWLYLEYGKEKVQTWYFIKSVGNRNYMCDFDFHADSGSVVRNFKSARMCLSSYDSIRKSIE